MNILKPIDTFVQIHPLNATHLLRTQPHRVYGDAGGNILEITVKRFAHTILDALYSHGGIIVSRYHDVTTDGDISTDNVYILSPSGDIRGLRSDLITMDIGIEPDILYMLLNPVEMNNWIVQDSRAIDNMGVMQEERRRFARRGLGIDIATPSIRPAIKDIVAHARSIYQKHISR